MGTANLHPSSWFLAFKRARVADHMPSLPSPLLPAPARPGLVASEDAGSRRKGGGTASIAPSSDEGAITTARWRRAAALPEEPPPKRRAAVAAGRPSARAAKR